MRFLFYNRTIMKYILYSALVYSVLAIGLPMVAWGTSYHYPSQVKHIFLNDLGGQSFEVIVELKTGRLYRMDSVQFISSRYQLFEDVADVINEHRYFRGFDDEDAGELIYGLTPFTVEEITDIQTHFSEKELAVILTFNTGDQERITRELVGRFSSSVEVTAFVAETINNIEALEGTISTAQVLLLHEEPYTGLSYFAPVVEEIVVGYDSQEQEFMVTAHFGNEEIREFDLAFKDTKEQLVQDITATINEVYVEYEDARFETQDLMPYISYIGVPWMIDDLESIQITDNINASGTLEFTVRARLTNGLVGVITLNKLFSKDQRDLELVALSATEALEENELFVHDFNVSRVYDLIVDSLDEIDLEYYRVDQDTPIAETEDVDARVSAEDQGLIVTEAQEKKEEKEQGSVLSEQDMIDLLIAIILQYVAQEEIDFDTSLLNII